MTAAIEQQIAGFLDKGYAFYRTGDVDAAVRGDKSAAFTNAIDAILSALHDGQPIVMLRFYPTEATRLSINDSRQLVLSTGS